jgi:hypothetical protein
MFTMNWKENKDVLAKVALQVTLIISAVYIVIANGLQIVHYITR